MIGIYVDDTISTEDRSFEEKSKLTEHFFESKKRNYDSFTFVEVQIMQMK